MQAAKSSRNSNFIVPNLSTAENSRKIIGKFFHRFMHYLELSIKLLLSIESLSLNLPCADIESQSLLIPSRVHSAAVHSVGLASARLPSQGAAAEPPVFCRLYRLCRNFDFVLF